MSSRYPVTRLPADYGVDIDTLKNFLLRRIAKEKTSLYDLQQKYARKTKRSPASSRYPIGRIDEVNEEGWNLGSKKSKKSKKRKVRKQRKVEEKEV